MGCVTMNSFSIFFLLSLFHLSFTTCEEKFHLTKGYEIHIVNGLPSNKAPLKFRCQSGNDDLGYHTLLVGEEYSWKFHIGLIGNTLYFCHFYWERKDAVFDVFDGGRFYPECDHPSLHDLKCYWLVKADGFYFAEHRADPNSPSWKKKVSW